MDLLAHEDTIRLTLFLSVLAVMALWELAAPRRRIEIPRVIRWSNNLALVVIDSAVLRLILPTLAVGAAAWAEGHATGLFPLLGLTGWPAMIAALLILDVTIWAQHVLFHKVPVLWRLHRMHHSDTGFDVTTGLRFHPLEILASMAIKIAIVVALGAPPEAVLLFELILNAAAMFNHGNITLPPRVDAALRWVLVTPDMHRVHHSEIREETDSNYGFAVPWWDRLFGTYRADSVRGQTGIRFGIGTFKARREAWLDRLLTQPFRNPD